MAQSKNDTSTLHLSHLIKSASFTDDLLFCSNVHPFGTAVHLPASEAEGRAAHTTSPHIWNAVDGDLTTCWCIHRDVKVDDYFAIDLLRPQSIVVFTVTFAHDVGLQQTLEIRISFDGKWWLPYMSLNGIHSQKRHASEQVLQTILYNSSQFNLGFQSFRYVAFYARTRSHHRFHVCDVRLLLF